MPHSSLSVFFVFLLKCPQFANFLPDYPLFILREILKSPPLTNHPLDLFILWTLQRKTKENYF